MCGGECSRGESLSIGAEFCVWGAEFGPNFGSCEGGILVLLDRGREGRERVCVATQECGGEGERTSVN